MSIHVRPIDRARNLIRQRMRRNRTLALGAAAVVMLLGGLLLYLHQFLIEQENIPTFTYVTTTEEEVIIPEKAHQPTPGGGSSSAAAAAANVTPDIIVTTTSSVDSPLMPMDFDLGEGLAIADPMEIDFGLGLSEEGSARQGEGTADSGEGGKGKGTGRGHGNGNGGGKGYNDDIQIVLVLDASGSMQNLFTAVADALNEVFTALSQAKLNGNSTRVNVGIVVYGQAHQNGAPFTLSRFTDKPSTLKKKVQSVECNGSNEECGNALMYAIHNFPWNMRERDDMLKVIFICGNEAFDMGRVPPESALSLATSANIIVNTIHCGPPDSQWQEAALLGNGRGLDFDMQLTPRKPRNNSLDKLKALRELHRIPLLPIGSPAEQQELLEQHRGAGAPPAADKQLVKWMSQNRERIINGFSWDAVELCRRHGADFSLELIGGVGNLPLSLRGNSPRQALQIIRQHALKRSQALRMYHEACDGSDFTDNILETLQDQAQQKGIIIEL